MIYMIGGKARSGKDTFTKYLKKELESIGKKVCVMQLSLYLKVLIREYLEIEMDDNNKPRKLLQELGTDIIREKMGKKYFYTNRLIEDIEILSNYFDTFIVSDVRLPLEYEEVSKKFSDVNKIYIERENNEDSLDGEEAKHITEVALDSYHDYDFIIKNITLESLENDARRIVGGSK